MSTFRILLADNHPVFRMGVNTLIGSHQSWEVCGEAADGREAVTKCLQLKPDLLIMDICLPHLNGVGAAREIFQHYPEQGILVLTNVESEQVIRDCLQAGVRGWVFKSEGAEDLGAAIEAMQYNRTNFSSRVSDLIFADYLQPNRLVPAHAMLPTPSQREREVVQLVSEGKTSKEIAALLGVSVKTVETHRSNVMFKLNLHSTVELVMYAIRNGIVHVQLPVVLRPTPPTATVRADLALSTAS
jgi:DNA-binding NarL/FixJ family response regulator